MDKLRDHAEQMRRGKESAEEKIRTMSGQLLSQFQQYREGLDDILDRNKSEFEATKRKLDDEIVQLRQMVGPVEALNVQLRWCNCCVVV